jgi:hypothetical protein
MPSLAEEFPTQGDAITQLSDLWAGDSRTAYAVHDPQRFASSLHAHKQARKNRFSFEAASSLKFSLKSLTCVISARTSERLKRSVRS